MTNPIRTIICLQLAAAFAIASAAVAAVTSTTAPAAPSVSSLPDIWQKVGPRERLKAVRAAELDGNRLLVERIYGIDVDGESTVYDLALKDDTINGAVQETLVGAVTVGEPTFFDDGRVELIRAVRIQDVIERINKVIKHTQLDSGKIKVTTSAKHTVETKEKNIDVMGNAALPGSPGQQKVLAKRAAEMDAYRKLAERLMGVEISSDTTVKDLATESDEIRSALAAVVKGATPTEIQYQSDNTCKVTLEIKYEDIIRTVRQHLKDGKERVSVRDSVKTRKFSETGIGFPRQSAQSGGTAAVGGQGGEPFFEARVVIEQVVDSKPTVE